MMSPNQWSPRPLEEIKEEGYEPGEELQDKKGYIHPWKVYKPTGKPIENNLVIEHNIDPHNIVLKELNEFKRHVQDDVANEVAREDLLGSVNNLIKTKTNLIESLTFKRP